MLSKPSFHLHKMESSTTPHLPGAVSLTQDSDCNVLEWDLGEKILYEWWLT